MEAPKRKRPRMCVGCREEKTKRELLRIVRNASGEDVKNRFIGKSSRAWRLYMPEQGVHHGNQEDERAFQGSPRTCP